MDPVRIQGMDIELSKDHIMLLSPHVPVARWATDGIPKGNARVQTIVQEYRDANRSLLNLLQDPRLEGLQVCVHPTDQPSDWKESLLTVFSIPFHTDVVEEWLYIVVADNVVASEDAIQDNLPSQSDIEQLWHDFLHTKLEDILQTIRAFRPHLSLEFLKITVFNNRDVEHGCLASLEAEFAKDREHWVDNWARDTVREKLTALNHAMRYRVLVVLVRRICAIAFDSDGQVRPSQVAGLQSFQHLLPRILYVCLPMDRALFSYNKDNPFLNPWVDSNESHGGFQAHRKRCLELLFSSIISDFDQQRLGAFVEVDPEAVHGE